MSKQLIACTAVCASLSAAPAYSGGSAGGGFRAVDFAWVADGGSGNELTIAPEETVTFAYPSGSSFHNVVFESQPSSCQGVPPATAGPGWQGSCRFDDAGTYRFACGIHPRMTGRVIVRSAPAPTATAEPTGTPAASATPAATATPAPGATPPPGATPQPAAQRALQIRLARTQRGTRVRGTVEVQRAGSRLEVTARTTRRVGRYVRRSTAPGTVAFSVGLDARARRTLRGSGRLSLQVTIVLTPPGGKPLARTARTRLTRG